MTLRIYQYVVTLAEESNFTKAAKKLYISQPSLSQIIRREEERLGFDLFNRTQNIITPTQLGLEYIKWAKIILNLSSKMHNRLECIAFNDTQIINIGILPECSAFILPKPLKQFREKFPNAIIKIVELSSNDLHEKLEDDDLDFIIGLTHPDSLKYISIPLYNEKIVLAMSNNYLSNTKPGTEVNLQSFEHCHFVLMNDGQFLNKVTYQLCQEAGFSPRISTICYNLETALHMVKAGVGVSLIPDLMIRLVEDIDYYPLKDIELKSQISIVYPRSNILSDHAKNLIDFIKKNVTR